MEYEEYVSTREAMIILGIKSETTIIKHEKAGKIKVYRPFANRKRYKVAELLKLQNKG
jgi:hypothetical protein